MRTGTRCTILIQLPEAFCAGSSAKALPLPAASADQMAVEGRPLPPYRSARTVTGWPARMSRSCTFLEVRIDPHIIERHHRHERRAGGDALAHLHASAWRSRRSTGDAQLACDAAPARHCAPPPRRRAPADGLRSWCRRSAPRSALSCSRAASSAARATLTASRACDSSSPEIAPSASRPPRRCRSSLRRAQSDSRCAICARSSSRCANSAAHLRTARASSASASAERDLRIGRIELEPAAARAARAACHRRSPRSPCRAPRW